MTASFRTHGLDLRTFERLPGSVYAFDGTVQVGTAFPVVIAEPDGSWYGRRTGKAAVRFAGRHLALAHIVGGCPDCSCEPGFCRTGGLHCAEVGCGFCLNGCSANVCPATVTDNELEPQEKASR
jgi:hypothetical protein